MTEVDEITYSFSFNDNRQDINGILDIKFNFRGTDFENMRIYMYIVKIIEQQGFIIINRSSISFL